MNTIYFLIMRALKSESYEVSSRGASETPKVKPLTFQIHLIKQVFLDFLTLNFGNPEALWDETSYGTLFEPT